MLHRDRYRDHCKEYINPNIRENFWEDVSKNKNLLQEESQSL
jgi:hypothetical protein